MNDDSNGAWPGSTICDAKGARRASARRSVQPSAVGASTCAGFAVRTIHNDISDVETALGVGPVTAPTVG
jgi:hypothetical protein